MSGTATAQVRDERTGVRLSLPQGWERVDAPGFQLAIAGPAGQAAADGTTFRPNLTALVAPADDDADLRLLGTEMLAAATVTAQGARVMAYDLWLAPDGTEGRRVELAHQQGPVALCTTQVVVLHGGAATTVTATCGVAQLPAVRAQIDHALGGFGPGTAA